MDWKNHIESTPGVCGGAAACQRHSPDGGISAGRKAAGWTEAQILADYSQISADDLRAVFAFTQARIEEEKYLPLPHVA